MGVSTGVLHSTRCFEILDVVVGSPLRDIEFVDDSGNGDRTVLQDMGIQSSECRCVEKVGHRLEPLKWWSVREGGCEPLVPAPPPRRLGWDRLETQLLAEFRTVVKILHERCFALLSVEFLQSEHSKGGVIW